MKKFFRTKQLVALLLIVAMLIPTTNIHTVYSAPETSGYNDTVLASLSESRVFLRAGKSKKIKCNVPIGKTTWKSSKNRLPQWIKMVRLLPSNPARQSLRLLVNIYTALFPVRSLSARKSPRNRQRKASFPEIQVSGRNVLDQ